jgi:hypothetical protein
MVRVLKVAVQGVVIAFLGLIVLGAFVVKEGRQTYHAAAVAPTAASVPVKKTPVDKWSYNTYTEEMSGKTKTMATIYSENTVNFDFPYHGAQRAHLTLWNDGTVLFAIDRGQLQCPSYDSCAISVRFDDQESDYWLAKGLSDGSTESIWISDGAGFVKQLRAARVVRIMKTVYQNGAPVFRFDVHGLRDTFGR